MRFAIILAAAALLAAPAVAQRAVPAPVVPRADQAPPPEGFYKDIPDLYDLLARPVPLGSIMMVNGQRTLPKCPAPAELTDADKVIRHAHLEHGVQSLYKNSDGDLRLCVVAKGDLPKGR